MAEKDWVHFSNCDPVFWVDFAPSYCKRCGNYWASSGALKWNGFNNYLQFLCLSIELKKIKSLRENKCCKYELFYYFYCFVNCKFFLSIEINW